MSGNVMDLLETVTKKDSKNKVLHKKPYKYRKIEFKNSFNE